MKLNNLAQEARGDWSLKIEFEEFSLTIDFEECSLKTEFKENSLKISWLPMGENVPPSVLNSPDARLHIKNESMSLGFWNA